MLKQIIGITGVALWAILIVYVVTISATAEQKKQTPPVKDSNSLEKMAKDFVNLLVKEDFNKAVKNFDDTMKTALPAEKLKEVWNALLAQFGPFEKQLNARSEKVLSYDVIYITCKFQKDFCDVKVVYNDQKQITGLFFVPAKEQSK